MKRSFCLLLIALIIVPICGVTEKSNSINILLLGNDNFGYVSVTDTEEISRADAIFVLNINNITKQMKLLSIERDYLVTLPNELGENKLATSTYFGGPQMAITAINNLLDLNLDLYMQMDIDNFITAIDLFDGVVVDVLPDELEGLNDFIKAIRPAGVPELVVGNNHLNGNQAWAFMSQRNHELDAISSNVERTNRQKRLFSAVVDKVLSMDIATLLNKTIDALPLIDTNISMNNLLKIIETTLYINIGNINFEHSPHGSYSLKKVNMHRLIVPDDMAAEIKFVNQFLAND